MKPRQTEPLSAALMRARKAVRKYISEGVSLSEDLIRERKQAAIEKRTPSYLVDRPETYPN